MADVDGSAAIKKGNSEEYMNSYERIFGWKCRFCYTVTKEQRCPKCNKTKDETTITN